MTREVLVKRFWKFLKSLQSLEAVVFFPSKSLFEEVKEATFNSLDVEDTYKRQFWNHHPQCSQNVDSKVCQVVVGIVGA